MPVPQCAAADEGLDFLQCLFQGLSEATTGALQGNAQVQEAQGMTQKQINQLFEGQANL